MFVGPQILGRLIAFTGDASEPAWRGPAYAGVLLVTAFLQSVLMSQDALRATVVGMRARTALVSAIYRKALRVSSATRRERTAGEIVNLVSVDTERMLEACDYLPMGLSSIVEIVVALFFLWDLLGVAALAGLASFVVLTPVNAAVAKLYLRLDKKQMKNKDARAKLMNEILAGMKVLKLYAWEPAFGDMVGRVRKKEVAVMRTSAYLQAGVSFIFSVAPFLVTLVSFATYVLIDDNNVLDAQKAFVALSLFGLVRYPLAMLPMIFMMLGQARVSIRRIDEFLNAPDLDEGSVHHDVKDASGDVAPPLSVKAGTFAWGPGEEPVLRDVSVSVAKGQVVAVVGAVGAGKSTLLSAMLGETEVQAGRVNSLGSVAYVPQQAWILNATLRDNILFGRAYDARRYARVVEACALGADLAMLPAGDQTEIGEKGVNLSGGQKQRVSLARAVYNDADIYLLDDPLSAVDSHVGKHIFDQVIGPTGLLKHKTRVLVTHSVAHLPSVDVVVVLKDGAVSEQGSYSDLVRNNGAFAEFLVQHLQKAEPGDDDFDDEDLKEIKSGLEKAFGKEALQRQLSQASQASQASRVGGDGKRSRTTSQCSHESASRHGLEPRADAAKDVVGQRLTEEEEVEVGNVKSAVYWHYIRSIGIPLTIATVLMNVLSQGAIVGASVWVELWTGDPAMSQPNRTDFKDKRDFYLGVYGAFGVAQAVFSMGGAIVFAFGCIASSVALHDGMLRRTLLSPMSFFDTTPVGRVLNRFTHDIASVDNELPNVIKQTFATLFSCLTTLVVISASTPLFLSVVVPLGLVYFFEQRFFVATSRQLQRLESASKSPVYSHFSETLTGCSSIRAYGAVDRFVAELESRVDANQRCHFPVTVANQWLAVRTELVGNCVVFFASLFAVLGRGAISPGTVGLSVSYAMQITEELNWLVRFASFTENNIVAVERIRQYEELPQETPCTKKRSHVDSAWPAEGAVEFREYAIRYREGLDLVLRGIDVRVEAGEKVGIVGRTGAGKSSLTLGLFRIVEAAAGQILVDGVDIAGVDLHTLRSRITIIPQDPVLFTGSLRANLDPYERYSDEAVWRALERAHLKDLAKGFAAGLNHAVAEGGDNLSVGQRQLVCLARALLRKTKVLVFDEATAAVDLDTDDLIQKTIREDFKECTILTIAHRLNTIMDCNRVLVLDKGKVVEFDSPQMLLQRNDSMFYSLAKDAGLV
ncbi:multidrug resistance-associated protein 1-like [Frankliniella occidentalis]|uniref:ABC-type glutathione-S-conjugate transporter n=1 Tax=Frankliniella occidentalis TaxID=133901 RepID=A0A9C6XBQ5_FRAOC|nr:multidrug resistance-associated protein 1-like [Frankliniella occidentalis]